MPQSPRSGQPGPPPERSATVIETDEDLRQALLSGLRTQQHGSTVVEPVAPAPPDGCGAARPSQASPRDGPPLYDGTAAPLIAVCGPPDRHAPQL